MSSLYSENCTPQQVMQDNNTKKIMQKQLETRCLGNGPHFWDLGAVNRKRGECLCGATEVETELVSLEARSNLLTDASQTPGNLVTSTHLFQLDHGWTFSLSDHLQSKQILKRVGVDGAGE